MSLVALALVLRTIGTLVAGARGIDAGPAGVVEVVWRGCEAELDGPQCVTATGKELVVWTRLRDVGDDRPDVCDRPVVSVAGRGHRTLATGADDGGCWTRLVVEDPGGALELRGPDGGSVWTLPFAPDPPVEGDLAAATAMRERGDPAGALRLLASAATRLRPAGVSLELARVLDLERKLAIRSADFSRGLASALAAREMFTELGWTSRACDITFALVHHHWINRRDADASAAELQAALPCVANFPRYAVDHHYYRAMLVEARNDPFATWIAYRDLDVLARRIRYFDLEGPILARQYELADQLHLTEVFARVEERVRALAAELPRTPSCPNVTTISNMLWPVLMRRERGEAVGDPRRELATVRAQYEASGPCTSVDDFRNATVNLALAELQQGDPGQAELLLVNLGESPGDPEVELWRHRILARAGLARNNLKLAGTHADALDELARRHADPQFAWHASFTRGVLHLASEQPDAAMIAFVTAEASRDEMALPLALGAGRERARVDWDESARRLIQLQLDRGQPGAALRTARLSRRRALRAIERLAASDAAMRSALAAEVSHSREATDADVRNDARRTEVQLKRVYVERRRQQMTLRHGLDAISTESYPASEFLREPEAGELLLLFYPFGDRWLAFADDGARVRVGAFAFVPEMSDEQLGRAMYGPFADEIAAARQVRILASGALLERDLHGLPHLGEPLFAQVAVAYALDLEAPPELVHPPEHGLVVVANPGGDVPRLGHVVREAQAVERAWAEMGLTGERLAGAAAVRQGVLSGLSKAAVFHFVGHDRLRPEAKGSEHPWDHELVLEQGTSLGVEDLMLPSAGTMPRVVVLSACSTGKVDPRAASGGVAIGPLFLFHGAALVVATARPIADAEAARLAEALYQAAPDLAALADPAALATAQTELIGDDACSDHRDICAYRALVR